MPESAAGDRLVELRDLDRQVPKQRDFGTYSMISSSIKYVLYSETTNHTLSQKLGLPEYSYFFVREAFRLLLQKHSTVAVVTDPGKEVDAIFDSCAAEGEECIFLSFAPPHRSFVSLRCPTIPVFAWEFNTIPSEMWDLDCRNDWRKVLMRFGHAITHSRYSANAIRDALGSDFPVVEIPAPIWNETRKAAETNANGQELVIPVRYFLRL